MKKPEQVNGDQGQQFSLAACTQRAFEKVMGDSDKNSPGKTSAFFDQFVLRTKEITDKNNFSNTFGEHYNEEDSEEGEYEDAEDDTPTYARGQTNPYMPGGNYPTAEKYLLLVVRDLESSTTRELFDQMMRFLSLLIPSGTFGPIEIVKAQRTADWYTQRQTRVTASKFGVLCKRRTMEPPETMDKLVHNTLNPGKFTSPATDYGTKNESKARDEYVVTTGNFVSETGFWTRSETPWMGGSPDGLVTDRKSKENGLLEIKCPYSARSMTIKQYNESYKSSYLEPQPNGLFKLKRNHNYYYQIQGCLYLLNMNWCDFVVWTEKDIHIERINRDQPFIDSMIPKLAELYCRFLLPSLASGSHRDSVPTYKLLSKQVYTEKFKSLLSTR